MNDEKWKGKVDDFSCALDSNDRSYIRLRGFADGGIWNEFVEQHDDDVSVGGAEG
ncbi:MAG: hypothetical protein U0X92_04365 [Anaerolineales bacterium]